MIVSHILGGFGNQLSAFVCAYSIAKELGQELLLDVADFVEYGYCHPYMLDKLDIPNYRKIVYCPRPAPFLDRRQFPEIMQREDWLYCSTEDIKTREELINSIRSSRKPNIIISGYGGLQYCRPEDIHELKAMLRLKKESTPLKIFNSLKGDGYNVALHIRRTDFVSLKIETSDLFFKAAITYVKQDHPDANFWFFSDDIGYVKGMFGDHQNYHFVHLLGGRDVDLDEFYCLSQCDCRILSKNSTYSSWASFLSDGKEKDICKAGNETVIGEAVFLDDKMIKELSAKYSPGIARERSGKKVSDEAQLLIESGEYDEAVNFIDRNSFDSFSISADEEPTLYMLKAAALRTKDDNNAFVSRLFYHMVQDLYNVPVVQEEYSSVLYDSGKFLESAVHAALAYRYEGTGDIEKYAVRFEHQPEAKDLFYLLAENKPRHFVVLPIEGWNFYKTYVKSLAIILAQMGNKVTFVIERGIKSNCENYRMSHEHNLKIVSECFSDFRFSALYKLDSIYNYRIDCLNEIIVNGSYSMIAEELYYCIKSVNMPVVLIGANKRLVVELKRKLSGLTVIVPDYCDRLNRDILNVGLNHRDYYSAMAGYADVMYVSENAKEKKIS